MAGAEAPARPEPRLMRSAAGSHQVRGRAAARRPHPRVPGPGSGLRAAAAAELGACRAVGAPRPTGPGLGRKEELRGAFSASSERLSNPGPPCRGAAASQLSRDSGNKWRSPRCAQRSGLFGRSWVRVQVAPSFSPCSPSAHSWCS